MPIRVFWGLVAGFILGVAARSLFPVGLSFVLLLCLVACSVLVVSRTSARVYRQSMVLAVFFGAIVVGVVRADMARLVGDPELDALVGQKVAIEGVVAREPDIREGSVRIVVDAVRIASTTTTLQSAVLAVVPAFTDVSYGNRVRLAGTLRLPEAFEDDSGRVFDYPGYLAAQGIAYQLAFAHVERAEGFYGARVVRFAIAAKQYVSRGLERALPDPHAGLAAGITVGDKRSLGDELTEEFRQVSLVHLIVLSGYNIAIALTAVFILCARFPRAVRFGAGASVAIFFALMTGFASASLRAVLMALISISGSLSGRLYKPDRALGLVAAGMLVWNPLLLLYDPGYQLSIVATAGLIVFGPIVSAHSAWVPWASVREIVGATVSAQVAVLPLLLYSSGLLSLAALPANFLVLAVVPVAMLMSGLASIGGLFAGPLAVFVGFPAYVLLSYMIGVAHLLAALPLSSVQVPMFSAWWLMPFYVVLIGGGLLLQRADASPKDVDP